jgi:ferrous iron transport protein B
MNGFRGIGGRLDKILTHRIWGYPIFFLILWIMFEATFRLGGYPMRLIESGVDAFSLFLSERLPGGILKDLLIEGIINGIGGVIVFLPNILILFFFISLMEDTGYMARVVMIMDKVMHQIGLHGKSFIPMIMGFGCNVPAILATRTIEDKNDRLVTMLINPFFSCSARLPVYVLLISALFPDQPGTILFIVYLVGIIIAVLTSLFFKSVLFKRTPEPYEVELPAYQFPSIGTLLSHMWDQALQYLKKIGGVILIATIIIWALGYFPHQKRDVLPAEQQEHSFIGQIGKWIEPAIRPLGFDWKMGVAILTGISAKEIIVSTMGVLYLADEHHGKESTASLISKLRDQVYTTGPRQGEPIFTPLSALSFMIFILLYFPCIGTLATISRVSGHWKWGIFTLFYTTFLAYGLSLGIYQIGSLIL